MSEIEAAAPVMGEPTAPETSAPEVISSNEDRAVEAIQEIGERIEKREEAKQYTRAPDGRFGRQPIALRPGETVAPETPVTAEKPAPAQTQLPGPQQWSAEMRQRFASLPPEVQNYISEREQSAHNKISQLGSEAVQARDVSQVIDRYKEHVPANMPTPVVVEHLLAAHRVLEANAAEGIKLLAQSYNIDLAELAGVQSQAAPQIDHAALAEIQAHAIAEAREEARVTTLIDQFTNSSPHWAELEADIYEQAVAIKATNPRMSPDQVLRKAYDRAVRVSDRFAQSQQAERTAAEQKATEGLRKKAADAKRMGSLNVKSSAASPVKTSNWQDTMRAVADRIY